MNNLITNDSIEKYKHLLQYIIKKGKKATLETKFRQGLLYWIKTIEASNFEKTLDNAFLNVTPYVSVKTKRKGSKNIYLPLKITNRRSKYLGSTWILKHGLAKKKRNFIEGVVDEIFESSLNKSLSVKKRDDLHKLAEESLVNFK